MQVPKHLKEKLETLTTQTYCQLCSLVLNAPLQAAQHYQGKNHAKRVRLFVSSNGNIAVGKATSILALGLGAVGDAAKAKGGEEEKKEGLKIIPVFDVSPFCEG